MYSYYSKVILSDIRICRCVLTFDRVISSSLSGYDIITIQLKCYIFSSEQLGSMYTVYHWLSYLFKITYRLHDVHRVANSNSIRIMISTADTSLYVHYHNLFISRNRTTSADQHAQRNWMKGYSVVYRGRISLDFIRLVEYV